MDTGSGNGPGEFGGSPTPVKLVDVTATDLAAFAETEQARRLDRLEADQELVLQLALRGYAGSAWDLFAAALAEYGFQVLCAWLLTGAIFRKCKEKGLGLGAVPESLHSIDDAKELAGEAVAFAIRDFRQKVLIPGRWDPAKGATLKTYFIGQCIFQFPNTFRRWVVEQDVMPMDAATLGCELELRTVRHSTETMVEVGRTLEAVRSLPRDHPMRVRVLVEMGYTQKEIADLLETTEKAIEMKIYRNRRKRGLQ